MFPRKPFYEVFSKKNIFEAFLDFFFPVNRNPQINYEVSEELRNEIDNNKDNIYVSISIDFGDYQIPVGIPEKDFYKNLINYIDTNFGYKSGRNLYLYQVFGKFDENSDFRSFLNLCSYKYERILWINAEFKDHERFTEWYRKNGDNCTKEEILSMYPIHVNGKPFLKNQIFTDKKSNLSI